uniref:Uncharacterized protein n=1 Tax=Aureoumbra lagunensis TaxID=44058 RepID=A0A7S3NNW3_9STRA
MREPLGDEVWQMLAIEIGPGWKLEYQVLRQGSCRGLESLLWRNGSRSTAESKVMPSEEIRKKKVKKSYRFFLSENNDKYIDFGKDEDLEVRELTPKNSVFPMSSAIKNTCSPVATITTIVAQTLRQVIISTTEERESNDEIILCAAYPFQLVVRADEDALYLECFEWCPDEFEVDLTWTLAPLLLRNYGESRAYRIRIPFTSLVWFKTFSSVFAGTTTDETSKDKFEDQYPLCKLVFQAKIETLDFAVRRVRPLQRFDGDWITIPDWTGIQTPNHFILYADQREIEDLATLLYKHNPHLYNKEDRTCFRNKVVQPNTWSGQTNSNNACLIRAVRENRIEPSDPDATYYVGDCVDCGMPLECSVNDLEPLKIKCLHCSTGGRGSEPPPDSFPPNFSAWDGRVRPAEYILAQNQLNNIENEYVRNTLRVSFERIPAPLAIQTEKSDTTPAVVFNKAKEDPIDYLERLLLDDCGVDTVPALDTEFADLAVDILSGNEEAPREQLHDMLIATMEMRDRVAKQHHKIPAGIDTEDPEKKRAGYSTFFY